MDKDTHSPELQAEGCACRFNRRTVVAGLAAGGAVGIGLPAAAQDAENPAAMPPQVGDYFVLMYGDDRTTPVTPDMIAMNVNATQVWPVDPETDLPRDGSGMNLILMTRWDPAVLSPQSQDYAADGVIAQSGICTHASCEVTDWIASDFIFECPCHFSRFDPRQNGAVMQGPATRPLPALALEMKDGRIVVRAPFDGKVGGDV